MRRLTRLSRRRFGQGLGACLALAPGIVGAQDGARVVTVRVVRFAFVPDRVEIRPGDAVVWINDDLAPHTATAQDGNWETATLDTGDAGRVEFSTPGAHDYVCAYHPHMTGTVSVRSQRGG